MDTETIAAVATAMSSSGISIVRISGDNALTVADKVFRMKGSCKSLYDVKSHTIHYGFLYEGEEILDEVMVSVMRAPKSYTTEDTVEINCHGGVLLTNRVLELVLQNGARLAQPGEFTKRAFLHGRIDLTEAEAVMDLIQSQSSLALRSSLCQLQGSVSSYIKELREKILYEVAFIESALDDPEHISLEGYPDRLSKVLDTVIGKLDELIKNADQGRIMREGIRTVILGKPNAGKSSLLNFLAGEERAIVTDIAGTTRDTVEETIRIGEIGLHVIDTAGIRLTEDVVERIGVEKALRAAESADLILYVMDSSVDFDENDRIILNSIEKKNVVILLNKSDLPPVITKEMLCTAYRLAYPIVVCSIKSKEGLDNLYEILRQEFFHGTVSFENEVYLTNLRHKKAVSEARESLEMVKKSISLAMPEDLYTIDLMSAYSALGRIVGEEVGEDLIDEIFSKFCMGK